LSSSAPASASPRRPDRFGHLVAAPRVRQHVDVWRRAPESPLDRETVDGIIRKLVDIDEKLAWIVGRLSGEEDDAEEDGS
jgi:hypothetical protein